MNTNQQITKLDSSDATNLDSAIWFRVVMEKSSNAAIVASVKESDITKKIAKWWGYHDFAERTLGDAVDALKRKIDYNGVYNSFLLSQITEEEFEQASLDFVLEPSSCDSELVSRQIEVLLAFTKSDFTTSEIVEIFSAPEDVVEDAVKQLSLELSGSLGERLAYFEDGDK